MNIINIMAQNDEISKEFGDSSHTYKSYQRYKKHRSTLNVEEFNKKNEVYIDEKYFICINPECDTVNKIETIEKEIPENRTFRCRYKTWKKLKDVANEKGGSLENGIAYLLSLYDRVKRKEIGDDDDGDDYEINVAIGSVEKDKDKKDKDKDKGKKE